MRETLKWGNTSYTILNKGKVVLEKKSTACFSEFMGRFHEPYDVVRLYDIDCKPTIEYKKFFLQYVIDMFGIEGSFNDEYFEFKSQGNKIKDATVMSTVRLLWESLGGVDGIDTPNLLFKKLRDEECPHEDKLERFCYFYKRILNDKSYFGDGHSWRPQSTVIRSTKQYLENKRWVRVNDFFTGQ